MPDVARLTFVVAPEGRHIRQLERIWRPGDVRFKESLAESGVWGQAHEGEMVGG